MKVIALNQEQVECAIAAIEKGRSRKNTAVFHDVTYKTLVRAIRLYDKLGSRAFEPEKIPQRGIRYTSTCKKVNGIDYSMLLKSWH